MGFSPRQRRKKRCVIVIEIILRRCGRLPPYIAAVDVVAVAAVRKAHRRRLRAVAVVVAVTAVHKAHRRLRAVDAIAVRSVPEAPSVAVRLRHKAHIPATAIAFRPPPTSFGRFTAAARAVAEAVAIAAVATTGITTKDKEKERETVPFLTKKRKDLVFFAICSIIDSRETGDKYV